MCRARTLAEGSGRVQPPPRPRGDAWSSDITLARDESAPPGRGAKYHLPHRESADLDFFGGPAFNARDFARVVAERCRAHALETTASRPASEGFTELRVRDATEAKSALRVQLARTSRFRLAPAVRVAVRDRRLVSGRAGTDRSVALEARSLHLAPSLRPLLRHAPWRASTAESS